MLAETPRAEKVPEASEGMSELSEPQQGPFAGGMEAETRHAAEVPVGVAGMAAVSSEVRGPWLSMSFRQRRPTYPDAMGPEASDAAFATYEGMDAYSEAGYGAVGSGGMTLDNSDTMSEGMHSVMTGGISESMDAVLMAEPVVQASGMWGSLLASSTARGIRRHERGGRRDRHPDDHEYDD